MTSAPPYPSPTPRTDLCGLVTIFVNYLITSPAEALAERFDRGGGGGGGTKTDGALVLVALVLVRGGGGGGTKTDGALVLVALVEFAFSPVCPSTAAAL